MWTATTPKPLSIAPLVPLPAVATANAVPKPKALVAPLFYGTAKISGTVAEKHSPNNTPVARKVVLLHERTLQTVQTTWSDAVTGAYSFTNIERGELYTVVSFDHTGTYRAVIADKQSPT